MFADQSDNILQRYEPFFTDDRIIEKIAAARSFWYQKDCIDMYKSILTFYDDWMII
jgi:hypothetical protein